MIGALSTDLIIAILDKQVAWYLWIYHHGNWEFFRLKTWTIQTDPYVLIAEIEGSDEIKSWFPFVKQIVWDTHLMSETLNNLF